MYDDLGYREDDDNAMMISCRICLTTMIICKSHLSPIVLVISSAPGDSDASRFPPLSRNWHAREMALEVTR